MATNRMYSVAVPCIIVASVNAKVRWDAHWEHVAHEEHEHPRSERPEYPYQNIRTKNFWFGDGDKVSLFAEPGNRAFEPSEPRANQMASPPQQTLFWNDKVNYHKKDE